MQKTFYCSTGAVTPTGTYYTSDKYPWRVLFGNVYGQYTTRIHSNILFHSVPYAHIDKSSLKYDEYNKLGQKASSGCIRLAVKDAKWIYDYAPTGTKVKIVVGNKSKPGPLGKEKLPKSYSVNYDPTDPEVPDSRKKKDYNAKKISGYLTKDGKKVGY